MSHDTSVRRCVRVAWLVAPWLTVALAGRLLAQSVVGPPSEPMGGGGVSEVTTGPAEPAGLQVDDTGSGSESNGVFEPGEWVTVAPSWKNASGDVIELTGVGTGLEGPGSASYLVADGSARYGAIVPEATASCLDTGDCYALQVTPMFPRPLHWDAVFNEVASGAGSNITQAWTVHLGDSFSDVPRGDANYRYVETLLHHGVVTGCGSGQFCPHDDTTRAQAAVLVLASEYGPGSAPVPCTPGQERFTDVLASNPFCPWVEELARRGSVLDCPDGSNLYCPGKTMQRGEMAFAIVKTRRPPDYSPLACAPGAEAFKDVLASDPLCPWIEELAHDLQGTSPHDPVCAPDVFCPQDVMQRGSATRFLAAGLGLQLYGR